MAGVWKRDGTVAVTNGSKKVTGTGTTFADTKNGVAKGHLFCITSGTSVDFYEVDYVVSNTELYLVQAYRGVTATGKAYEIITTFSDSVPEFARRLTATLSAYQQQSDAFQALLTSTATTIEVTAPDGTKQTLIPWKRVTSEGEGQAARAKTEADKAAASAALAGDIVAASALPLPDVWAPLSDSLRLITGYGRDVLVGSDVVARMVNFSRSSTATYIGKDGQLKTAAVNEPRFEKEGLLIEGQSTNLFPWSQEFIGKWARVDGVASSDANFPNAINLDNTAPGIRYVHMSPGNLIVGTTYTITAIVKGYVPGVTNIRGVFANSPQDTSKVVGHFGDYTVLSFTKNSALNSNPTVTGIVWNSGDVTGVKFCALQIEALPFASSYIPTNGAAVTRAADIVTIPWAMNINPATVTVALNYDLLGVGQSSQRLIEYAAPAAPRHLMQVTPAGSFESYCGASPLTVSNPTIGPGSLAVASTSPTRHALRLTGKIIATATPTGPAGATSNVTIGAAAGGTAPMFGHVRNLRIWHRALTDDQLKAVA
ncbi:hypothetical protein ACLHZ9_00915 [Aeromonas media]